MLSRLSEKLRFACRSTLIYRTLFELRKVCSKPESIQMDWEEWVGFLHAEFPRLEDSLELYGVIAASKIFRTSMSLALFCRHFDLKERVVRSRLGERMLARHIEPVIYHPESGTLQPKHDVIAELFFLFNKEKISINSLMLDLLGSMDGDEIEKLLSHMVIKREMQNEIKYHVGQIQYWDYMECIYRRIEQGEIRLSEQGNAQVCLGFLWAGKQPPRQAGRRIPEVLQQLAPALEPSLLLLKLYTEWGIWAGSVRDDALAEEKFRGVMQVDPKNVQSRTELGRLLSKQRGREKEAEEVLREAIQIDPKNLHPHTELGRLLSKQRGREKEAEEVLREVIGIDSRNIMSRTELGRLLSKQRGREKEAEEVLREAIRIDPQNLHPHTELGRLLSRQRGREKEAEEVLRESANKKSSPKMKKPSQNL